MLLLTKALNMSKKDFEQFVGKVDNLNNLLKSVYENTERRRLLIKCATHDEVVSLAKEWGFDIGKRWGE